MTHSPPSLDTLNRIAQVVGPEGWTRDPLEMAPYLVEWRDRWQGSTPMVVKPATTDEAAQVVRICAETHTAIVPQGGNTGLVGGQIPFGSEVLLSLSRLNRIRRADPLNGTLTVEAGCTLGAVQEHARTALGLLFPLSLASEGSAQIGGLLSTNAGGISVVRYGTMRNLVLGLEVVTPQGEIWNGLRALRKDNTGYDLKHLFIGAEGTLGLITAAVCKLVPLPKDSATALVAAPDLDKAIALLHAVQAFTGNAVSAFELMPRIGIEFALKHAANTRDPFSIPHDWSVLMELSSGQSEAGAQALLESCLNAAMQDGLVRDAVIASSQSQADNLWRLRDCLSEVQKHEGASLKHDISVPVSALPVFVQRASAAVCAALPGLRPVAFGHIGDGNVHFNLSQPVGMDPQDFLSHQGEMARLVHDIVASLGGSISAEHGLGIAKREAILSYKSPVEIEMMRRLKTALDPLGIMNPGKVI